MQSLQGYMCIVLFYLGFRWLIWFDMHEWTWFEHWIVLSLYICPISHTHIIRICILIGAYLYIYIEVNFCILRPILNAKTSNHVFIYTQKEFPFSIIVSKVRINKIHNHAKVTSDIRKEFCVTTSKSTWQYHIYSRIYMCFFFIKRKLINSTV